MIYVTTAEYYALGYDAIEADDIEKFLRQASRHIDVLTFNRIVGHWDKLTPYQQDTIKTVICEHAEFLCENADAISSILNSYSINGVSMEFGTGFNVVIEGGLPIESTTYSLLQTTGLCCRLAR